MVDVPYPRGRDVDKTVDGPKNKWKAITPDDDEALDPVPCAVHCSSATGGNFTAVDDARTAVAFYIQPGQCLPIRPRKIKSTDLTENLTLVALYD